MGRAQDCNTKSGLRRSLNELGAAIVELAASITLLLLIVSGLIDYGMALHYAEVLTDITRNASRIASYEIISGTWNCTNYNTQLTNWLTQVFGEYGLNYTTDFGAGSGVSISGFNASSNEMPAPPPTLNVNPKLVIVNLEKKSPNCSFCLSGLIPLVPNPRASSIFRLPLSCP